MIKYNLQFFGGRGSAGGNTMSSGSKELSFETSSKLGLGSITKLSNGDEIEPKMSYQDRGANLKNLKKTSDMDVHIQDEFTAKGVGGKEYVVTRELIIYKRSANVKGGLAKSRIIKVTQK